MVSSVLLSLVLLSSAARFTHANTTAVVSGTASRTVVPPSSAATADILTEMTRATREALRNRTLKCVDFRILRDGLSTGDGFHRLGTAEVAALAGDPNSTRVGREILKANQKPYQIAADRLDGINVVLLETMASLGDFRRVLYDHLLNTLGYDCVLTAATIEPDWLGYMRFLPAHMTAGFAVFAPGPVLEGKPSAADTIFSWVTPFAGRTWALLLGSLVAVGIIMAWLESEVNHEDFPGTSNVHRLIHVWNGCYLSIAGFTSKTEEFSPKTIPGRVLGVLNSFAVWLALAAYIANLAAVYTRGQMIVEPILDVTSFVANDIPACISESFELRNFLGEKYPNIQLKILSADTYGTSGSGKDNLPIALGRGDCAGGITVDISFRDQTSPLNDRAGVYCGYKQKGFLLNSVAYAIAISSKFNQEQKDALNFLAMQAMASKAFVDAAADNFPSVREQCGDGVGPNDDVPDSLEIEEMAGIFMLQAVGCIIALVWYFVSRCSSLPVLPAAHIVLSSQHKQISHASASDGLHDHEAGGPLTGPNGTGGKVGPLPKHWVDNQAAGNGGEGDATDPILAMRRLLDRMEKERGRA